ncbi:hypothetical protein AAFF_G00054300 [Aldrovandia affinis]|uniref:C-type lectin domain-containing protein n=1 Tax=Aldrovandia affinis TaxID=143900 RepID=A0AAD7R1V0_9TELE|nr:hypothetical protein AAFF_G00054300 [Aldrovandia affinis]
MKQCVVIVLLISGLCTVFSCLSHQYHFVNIQKSWTEAQSYCRENHTDLATIDDPEEMMALKEAVDSGFDGEAWIGLYDDRDNWQWSLVDNGSYSVGATEFSNWRHGQPNNHDSREHCVRMSHAGTWSDVLCEADCVSICYDGLYMLLHKQRDCDAKSSATRHRALGNLYFCTTYTTWCPYTSVH